MRQHHGHTAGPGRHGTDHVLHPGIVTAFSRRHACEVASVGIITPHLVAPLFEGEGRIGDDAIERRQVVTRKERRAAQRVAAHHLKIRGAMQEEVHAGNGGGGEVFFLGEELAPERAVVAVVFLHMVHGFEQHTARAAGRVVDGLALARIEDVHHQPDHGARRVELTGLLVGSVGELFNQILVRLAEDVGLCHPVAQRDTRAMLDEVAQERVRKTVFVRVHWASPKMP